MTEKYLPSSRFSNSNTIFQKTLFTKREVQDLQLFLRFMKKSELLRSETISFHRFGASVHAKVISIFFHLFRKRQQVCENLEETPDVSRHEVKIRLLRSPPTRCSSRTSTLAPPSCPWPSPWSWRPTSCGQGLHEHDMTSTWCRFRDIMLNTRWVFDEFAMIIISTTTTY